MKKAKVVLVMIVIAMAVASFSCNKKLCPAYAKANTEQAHSG
jgi:hypothetical protein